MLFVRPLVTDQQALDSFLALIRLRRTRRCGLFGGEYGVLERGPVAALSWEKRDYLCIRCGGQIEDGLARFGSVLCHDCRDEDGIENSFEEARASLTSARRILRPRRLLSGWAQSTAASLHPA